MMLLLALLAGLLLALGFAGLLEYARRQAKPSLREAVFDADVAAILDVVQQCPPHLRELARKAAERDAAADDIEAWATRIAEQTCGVPDWSTSIIAARKSLKAAEDALTRRDQDRATQSLRECERHVQAALEWRP